METKLWPINPGLAVGLAGAGAFVAGMGVHVLTRGTTINTGDRRVNGLNGRDDPSSSCGL
eukprot:scaffold166_cov106-Skeletonema_dohrnii-CCMP3373.AAC.14